MTLTVNGQAVDMVGLAADREVLVKNTAMLWDAYRGIVEFHERKPITSVVVTKTQPDPPRFRTVITLADGRTWTDLVIFDRRLDPLDSDASAGAWRVSERALVRQLLDSLRQLLAFRHIDSLSATEP